MLKPPDSTSEERKKKESIVPGTADFAYLAGKALSLARGVSSRVSGVIGSSVGAILKITESPRETENIVTRQVSTIQGAAHDLVRDSVDLARDFRLIDRVNPASLQSLLDDSEEDLRLKQIIVDLLDTQFCAGAPFDEEINFVAQRCFDKGIPIKRVIDFFENERLLETMVEGGMLLPYSRYRGTSALAFGGSAVDSVIAKSGRFHENANRKEVDEEMEEKLILHMVAFEISYNKHYDSSKKQRKRPRTIEEFVTKAEEKYPEYNVRNWFLTQKQFFIKLLRGHSMQEWANKDGKYKSRVDNIVSDSYEERGKTNPEVFINNSISRFISYEQSSDRAGAPTLKTSDDVIWIYPEDIRSFFGEIIPRIHSGDLGASHTRALIINACNQFVEDVGRGRMINTLAIVDKDSKIQFTTYTSEDELFGQIKEVIKANTSSLTSYVDVTNLLAEPEDTPEGMLADYEGMLDKKGGLNVRDYRKHLKNVFELIDGDEEEGIRKIKERITDLFKDVENYIDSQYEKLGIPNVLDFEDIRNQNDYAKLLKIACTDSDPKRKFAARRKVELSWLIYSCKYSPRFAYKKPDSEKVQKRLEGTEAGIKIDPDAATAEMRYFEEDGKVTILEGGEEAPEGKEVKDIALIPAKFAGVDCYLLPAHGSNPDDKRYIDLKSLNSMVTKLMRKDKTRAKDITDLLRLTVVPKNEGDMGRITEAIEKNYVSFGRNLKRENRYGEFVRVQTVNTDPNDSKSEEYKTLRYVVDVPICGENSGVIYLAPIEARGLLPEDLAKERSTSNDASHENYELKRSREIMKILSPIEITPELYKTEGPHPHDIFEDTEIKLMKDDDFEEAA